MCKKIAAIYPPHVDNGRDERVGVGGRKNDYSVAVMYNNLCGFREEAAEPIWSKIWKLEVPERVRTFVWMVKHNRLLTNSLKSVMGLCHAMCLYCRDVEETILHVLRDCPIAKEVWMQVLPVASRGIFFMGDLEGWIEFNLHNHVQWHYKGGWCDFWAAMCHCLWTWKNKEVHEEEFVRPMTPVLHAMNIVRDYDQAMRANVHVQQRVQLVALIGWVPPKENFVKLNTDGASNNNNVAGCGGLVRDREGDWLGGFAKYVGSSSAVVAEAWGVLEGLRYVWNKGFRKVELNVDSLALVNIIKNRTCHSAVGGMIMKHIWRMMDRDWEVEVSHIYREANKCADTLAKVGCNLDLELQIFEICPFFLTDLVSADMVGTKTPRMVAV
jgi:ribonuclease HI